MPKQRNESYIDYKKRVLDPISSTFCGAKWYNATIWLGSGSTTSCHHPPAQPIDKEEILTNPSAIHNTKHKKEMRRMMLNGERPQECEYCWKVEDVSRDNVSDRVWKSVIYTDEDLQLAMQRGYEDDVNLKTLEIAFDRTCNFACSYCNASFSTTWANDIKKNGIYTDLVSDGGGAYTHDGSWADAVPQKDKDANPYIKAFWDWWPELSQSLTELRITGGEPLMSDDVWKLFDMFAEQQLDMNFAVNSNLGGKEALIDRFIEKSHGVKNLDLYTSCETFGAKAEYIRDGLDYAYWQKNLERVLEESNVKKIGVMMTINSLCLYGMTDFMEYILGLKEKFGKQRIVMSLNLLRFPSFMSPLALPEDQILDRHLQLKNWLDANRTHPMMTEMEIDATQRLVDYLDAVKTPHANTSDKKLLHADFKTFYDQYDVRRGKDFSATFPELAEWFAKIRKTIPITVQQ
ncbi:hypothetical protein RsoM2USA_202 [Ralstonia phage RsoM2USA]|nr:hypothetical protein RsoM2USA_202 [Ralstonia phage RsoM2USA]